MEAHNPQEIKPKSLLIFSQCVVVKFKNGKNGSDGSEIMSPRRTENVNFIKRMPVTIQACLARYNSE